jgi:hypothetical protein
MHKRPPADFSLAWFLLRAAFATDADPLAPYQLTNLAEAEIDTG